MTVVSALHMNNNTLMIDGRLEANPRACFLESFFESVDIQVESFQVSIVAAALYAS
jgi:hypothetical protein